MSLLADILAATGMEYHRNVRLAPELEEAAAKVQEEVAQASAEAERALEMLRQEGGSRRDGHGVTAPTIKNFS